jgi:alcohol dehydrogenase class IV
MEQESFLGRNSIVRLKNILQSHGPKKILLVTGKASFSKSTAEKILNPFFTDIQIARFCNFNINPRLEDAYAGVKLINTMQPDMLIAVGGGSVMDMAKTINILAAQKGPYSFVDLIKSPQLIENRGLPVVAVPTTSGSGSQATRFAVVYINGKKYSLAHEYMLPRYSIVDPIFTYNIDPALAAASGMDALCQAVESFWSVKSTNKSKQYSELAISLILPNIFNAVNGKTEAKDIMSEAADLAGQAINISTTTAPHAISYPLTSYFGVPHGHAVSLTLGRFFRINSEVEQYEVTDPRGPGYVSETMNDLFRLFGVSDCKACHSFWKNLMSSIGLETDLKKLGVVSSSDREKIIDSVNIERLTNNPIRVTKKILNKILSSS